MRNLEEFEALARRAEHAPVPQVDVRLRVRTTLRQMAPEAPALDRTSLAFAGLSFAVMLAMLTLSLPALTALSDPWAAYMSAPWSF